MPGAAIHTDNRGPEVGMGRSYQSVCQSTVFTRKRQRRRQSGGEAELSGRHPLGRARAAQPRMCPEMSADSALEAWRRPPETTDGQHHPERQIQEGATPPTPAEALPNTNNTQAEDSDSDISVGCPSPKPVQDEVASEDQVPSQNTSEMGSPSPRTPSTEEVSKCPDVGASPESIMSPPPTSPPSTKEAPEDEYFKPLKKLRMIQLQQEEAAMGARTAAGVRSFSITEILSHKPVVAKAPEASGGRIVRPWDTDDDEESSRPQSVDDMSVSSASSSGGSPRPGSGGPGLASSGQGQARARGKDGNPLDALFQMTSKTFEGLKSGQQAGKSLLYI
ncbi:hypothetical protein Pmani_039104 [Petrolisthes manimaculis]|uniref:Uncharacterized protein n=1 Tax=Petrolisthes manimaculis TaxID=1843537 RepID=A0AAE1TJL2_9EUCA|nr:hypothetical protein Pmani_039104 [Petrolisthes manimaculis]